MPGPVDFSAGSCTELVSRPGHCYREELLLGWPGLATEMEPSHGQGTETGDTFTSFLLSFSWPQRSWAHPCHPWRACKVKMQFNLIWLWKLATFSRCNNCLSRHIVKERKFSKQIVVTGLPSRKCVLQDYLVSDLCISSCCMNKNLMKIIKETLISDLYFHCDISHRRIIMV